MGAIASGYANALQYTAPGLLAKTSLGQKATGALGTSLGPLVGASGGANGTGYAKPTAVPIQSGTTNGQIGASYADTQNSLGNQQALLAALQSQNAIQAQNKAVNSYQNLQDQQYALNGTGSQGQALSQQQSLNNELAGAGGVQNLSGALASQRALAAQQQGTAAQYQGIANGTGPNPAMAALNQTTGQNVANQASLMAGQRGASANVGLLARQAAQQGAATQQQAVGQGATLQAQQQLGALSGLSAQQQAIGNTQQNIAGIAGQQIGQQQAGTIAQQQAASNIVAQQQAQQQALANQANQLVNQQLGATTANTQAQQSEQSLLQQALSGYNQQQVSQQGNINNANAGLANTNIQGQHSLIGGGLNAAGAAFGAEGGEVKSRKNYANGTPDAVVSAIPPADTTNAPGAQSSFGQFLRNWSGNTQNNLPQMASDSSTPSLNSGNDKLQKGTQSLVSGLGSKIMSNAKGGMIHDYRTGGNVKAKAPKEEAVKAGNSYSNDKIPAMLSEGEVVIPRSVMRGKDPVRGSAEFVAKVLAKRKRA